MSLSFENWMRKARIGSSILAVFTPKAGSQLLRHATSIFEITKIAEDEIHYSTRDKCIYNHCACCNGKDGAWRVEPEDLGLYFMLLSSYDIARIIERDLTCL